MKNFQSYIGEKVNPNANIHINHIEDLWLSTGIEGLEKSIEILKDIVKQLSVVSEASVQLTTKFDGSPALITGINPENKKFFVGTKSVFNKKEPKIIYTEDDIKKYYSDEPNLAEKLRFALKYLPELDIKTIYQGDLMFTSSDLKKKNIKGVDYIIFRPNTITYAVPMDSPLAKKIINAKIGIVFHSEYKGPSMDKLTVSYKPKLKLKQTPNVWYQDASLGKISDQASLTKEDSTKLDSEFKKIDQLKSKVNKQFIDTLSKTSEFETKINKFNNLLVRLGEKLSVKEKVVKLLDFFQKSYTQEIDMLKTEKGKDEKKDLANKNVGWLMKNISQLEIIYEIQQLFVDIKLFLLYKLEQIQDFSTFVQTDKGEYDITKPEGFVATTKDGVTKLVDRGVFSHLNLILHKDWGK